MMLEIRKMLKLNNRFFFVFRALSTEIDSFISQIITLLPDSRVGVRIRRKYYKVRLRHSGRNINIMSGTIIDSPDKTDIGDNVSINRGCLISSSQGEIIIKDNVLIGPYCVLRSAGHIFSNPKIPIKDQGHEFGRIIIDDDVWLGANVVILPNVRIGKGSIIGAGAVVTKDIEPYSIAVGVPARKIKSRR